MKSVFTTIAFILFCLQLQAQPGTLDYSFGDSGKIISTNFEGEARTSLLQPDEKIVVGGIAYTKDGIPTKGPLLARYIRDGSLDLSFGDKGRAFYNLGDTNYSKNVSGVALQKDGKIVAAGGYARSGDNISIFLMRLNSNGTVDETFGKGGIAINKLSQHDYVADMALLPDGRIAVTGNVKNGINDNNRAFLALYTVDGKLDKSFSDTGVAIYDAGIPIGITSIAITQEGKVITGGYYLVDDKTFLLRYNTDGTLDKSFGIGGMASLTFDRSVTGISSPSLSDIAIAGDNTIAAAGRASLNNIDQAILVSRFTENGTPDTSFGTNGYTAERFGDGDVYVNAVAVQQNGKILTGGYTEENDRSVFTLARFDRDGILDSSFGANGIQNTSFLAHDQGHSLLIQNDGKIVMSGNTYPFLEDKFPIVLARYYGDESKRQIIATRIKRWLQHHGITWQMDNSIRYYNVQRSNDGGVTYQPVAKVYNNHQTQYNYEEAAGKSNDLYRVAAVGKDGSRSYSNSVLISNESNCIVFPNPVRSTMQLQGLSTESKTNISIVDFTGTVRFSVTTNSSTYSINTSNLKPGNYFIKIETNKTITTQPFVKE